jgi:hypothetical protein
VKIAPGPGGKAAAIAVAEMKMQPIVSDFFDRLPTPTGILTEWTRRTARESDAELAILHAIGISTKTIRQSRNNIFIGETRKPGIVPHLIDELELAIAKLPEEKQKLQAFGLN